MKFFKFLALLFASCLIWKAVTQYFFCPIFNFSKPQSFSGDKIYNPYAHLSDGFWGKCNFHAHCKAWMGITNGHGTGKDIWEAYDSLGYTFHAVSNYHKIDTFNEHKKNYIPAYEHGVNLKKTHFLVIGANKVVWLNYFFPQTLSNKQHIINRLAADKDVVLSINHPAVRHSFGGSVLATVGGYRLIEALHTSRVAQELWDTALSAGRPVFVVGDDDIHDVFDRNSLGRYCTVAYVEDSTKAALFKALRNGRAVGIKIPDIKNETFAHKIERHQNLPQLYSANLQGNQWNISMNKIADSIVFTGQGGKRLQTITHESFASYAIKGDDTYVRVAAYFDDGNQMYLNPIYRYSSTPFPSFKININRFKTTLLELAGIIILCAWLLVLYNALAAKFVRKYLRAGLVKR